jgi:hypothetical protein
VTARAMRGGTALVLAELLDTALADNWDDTEPVLAVLVQASDDPDDVRLALRRAERAIEEELEPFAGDEGCLAVAHSTVDREARLTVAIDRFGHAGLLRRPGGGLEPAGDVSDPLVQRLRSSLPALGGLPR